MQNKPYVTLLFRYFYCNRIKKVRRITHMSLSTNKTLMNTGGTGPSASAVLNRFLSTDISEIHIFSRNEKMQDDMRHEYHAKIIKT